MILDFLAYEYMVRSLIAGIIIAITCPMIGNFIVAKRLSMISDTLAHITFAGVALGILVRLSPLSIALISTILGALGVTRLMRWARLSGEQALLLILSLGASFASIFITFGPGVNINAILFGSILFISWEEIFIMALVSLIAITVLLIKLYDFLSFSMDEELMRLKGKRIELYNLTLSLLMGSVIVIGILITGVLLISALMVIPVLSSMQISRSFLKTMLLSSSLGLVSVIFGMIFSFYLDIPPGGSIALINIAIFLISTMLSKLKVKF